MKRPETMIRDYETANPRAVKGTRIYGIVRPLRNGEFTFEVWAACNSRRKGNPFHCKKVFVMRSDRTRYEQRDILWYSSWCSLAPKDHWVVDMTEFGYGSNYMVRAYRGDERGKWQSDHILRAEWMQSNLPFATMLNGFEGTRYRYCGYDSASGLSPFAYLSLWDISPKVELLSKAGLFRLLTEEAVFAFSADDEFARWIAKNRETVRAKGWDFRRCVYHYGKKVRNERYAEVVARRKEAERIANEKAERKRIEERKRKALVHSQAINELYKRLVSICGLHKCYEVYVPKCSDDLVMEGEAMHNCVGKFHVEPVARGEEVMVFLRKDGKPYIDIAIDANTFEVTEIRGVCNSSVTEDERSVGDEIADKVRFAMREAS